MSGAAWGAALSGAGQFLGGVGQFAGGINQMMQSGNMSTPSKMMKLNFKHRLHYARKYGERYGFHPLAALGINPAIGGAFHSVGSDKASGLKSMEQGLDRMLTGQSEVQKAQARLLNAQADELQRKQGVTGQADSHITVKDLPLAHPAYASGDVRGQAVQPLEQLYRDDAGIIHAMPAEGAQDYMSESAIANIPYQFKKIWRQMFSPAGRS